MDQGHNDSRLRCVLEDASTLLESTVPAPPVPFGDLKGVLRQRLITYYHRRKDEIAIQSLENVSNSEGLQAVTAKEALSVLQSVQGILDGREGLSTDIKAVEPPPIGTRDLKKLRTLLSLVFKWGIDPLLTRLRPVWSATFIRVSEPQIVGISSHNEDYKDLGTLTSSLFALAFPVGVEGPIAQTLLTTSLLSTHATDLLISAITIGWLPPSDSTPPYIAVRPLVARFLRVLSATQAIAALGAILPNQALPPHVRKICGSLLTKQLLRPDGVIGLCQAMFGEEESVDEGVKLEKLQRVASIINAVPSGMQAQDYYMLILPRVIKLLSAAVPIPYRRAAAYTLYTSLLNDKATSPQKSSASVVLELLHKPLHAAVDDIKTPFLLEPRDALSAIASLVSNTEPSPLFISTTLSPIVSSLYMLSYDLSLIKTVDPQLLETIRGLLISWGKIIDQLEGVATLWSIIKNSKDGQWQSNLEGQIWRTRNAQETTPLSLLMPEDVRSMDAQEEAGEVDANIFGLYPDPIHIVEFFKSIGRDDISSALFVKLLEDYREMKARANQDSLKILNELQIILQMQQKLTGSSTSSILRRPQQLLTFILHVLQSAVVSSTNDKQSRNELVNGYRELDEIDSDDEAPDSEVIGPDDELIETALTLLLAILEANENLLESVFAVLHEISSTLGEMSLDIRVSLQPSLQEARLVITAILANDWQAKHKSGDNDTNIRESYQRALKLLQDPILPVRAHGLLLLRDLVTPPIQGPNRTRKIDEITQALVPSILSIFLQSVQDNDSYIFLNAVQGLAAMVDAFGKDVLQGLMKDYGGELQGLGASNLSQQDVDTRTRIGEALSIVVKRCGTALADYTDIIVPRLFAMIRMASLPTTLKSSSISLLSDCLDTYSLALVPYLEDLSQAMLDLLQLEAVPLAHKISQDSKAYKNVSGEANVDSEPRTTMDSEPTSNNPKFPPLRRAALHFLALLIRAVLKGVLESGRLDFVPRAFVQRAQSTLGYVSATDEDHLVRVMAREVIENLEELQQYIGM